MSDTDEDKNPYTSILEETGIKILQGIKDVEIDPTEADRIMSCDNPLLLSKAQRAVNIEILRRQRAEYLSKKAAKRSKKAEKAKPKISIEGLTLADLDLKIPGQ